MHFGSYLNPKEFERYERYKNKKINFKTDEENYNFNYLDEIFYSNEFNSKNEKNSLISNSITQIRNNRRKKEKEILLRNSYDKDFGPRDVTEMLEEIFSTTKKLEKTVIGVQRMWRINIAQVNLIPKFYIKLKVYEEEHL